MIELGKTANVNTRFPIRAIFGGQSNLVTFIYS